MEIQKPLIIIRKLDHGDLNQIREVMGTIDSHLGAKIDSQERGRMIERMERMLSTAQSERNILYGYFEDGNLLGWWGVYLWEALPYGTLQDLIIKKSIELNTSMNLMRELFEKIFSTLSEFNRHTIFLVTKFKPFIYKSMAENNDHADLGRVSPLMREFVFTLEAVISPNQISNYSTFAALLGNRSWPNPIMIRRGYCHKIAITQKDTTL